MSGILPSTITAGVTFRACAWRTELSGTEWSLVLMLRGPAVMDLPAERDGARHLWEVSATGTSQWTPGDYAYAIRATDGTEVREVEAGRVRILPNLEQASAGFDGRSANQIALDNIDAVLAKRATLDQERYRINNRELYRTPISELVRLRGYFAERVAREAARSQGRSLFGRQLKVVMKG